MIDDWDSLSEIDKKILILAGRTKKDIEEARKNWYGTTYPYDLKIDEGSEWIRCRFTQAEVEEIWHYAYKIRNMGSFGISKQDLPYDVITIDNFKVEDGKLIFISIPSIDEIEKEEAYNTLAEKIILIEEDIKKIKEIIQ